MLPNKIGKFILQEHILSLNEEDRKVFIQYKDDSEVSYTVLSTNDGVSIQFADPLNGKIKWVNNYEFIENGIESLKALCAKHYEKQIEEAMSIIKEKGLTDEFGRFITDVIETTIRNESAYYSTEDFWKIMEIINKQYKVFDFINAKEKSLTKN